MVSFTPWPLYCRASTRVPIAWEAGGSRAVLNLMEKRKITGPKFVRNLKWRLFSHFVSWYNACSRRWRYAAYYWRVGTRRRLQGSWRQVSGLVINISTDHKCWDAEIYLLRCSCCVYRLGFTKHSAPSCLVTLRPKEDFPLFRKFQVLVSDRRSRYFLAAEINNNKRHKLIVDNPSVNSSLLIKTRMLFNEQCDYLPYILEFNPHRNLIRTSFCWFLKRKKKLVRGSNPHLSFNRP